MIPLSAFLAAIQQNAARITRYESGGDGSGGGCDCIGLIIGAVRLAGGTWPGTHGSNYAARHVTDELHPVSSASGLMLGEIVYKARQPGQPGYDLPAAYDSSPDRLDYYHVGVVTSISPFIITHCTSIDGGIQRDTALGAWRYAGELSMVDYDGDQGEEGEYPAALYAAQVFTPNNDFNVRLRANPSINARIIVEIPQGSIAEVLQEGAGWNKIRVNGHTGWMMARFLVRETAPEPAPAFITVSRADLETAYTIIGNLLGQ